MPLIYGEGQTKAFNRLWKKAKKLGDNIWTKSSERSLKQSSKFGSDPSSVIHYKKNLEPTRNFDHSSFTEAFRYGEVYSDSQYSSSPVVPRLEDSRIITETNLNLPGVSSRERNGVDEMLDEEENLEAFLNALFSLLHNSLVENKQTKPQARSRSDVDDGKFLGKPSFQEKMMGDKTDTSTLGPILEEIDKDPKLRKLLDRSIQTGYLLQRLIEVESYIDDKKTQHQVRRLSVHPFIKSLVQNRTETNLESQKIVGEWLDVTKFNDRSDAAAYYDKQVSLCLQGTCQWIFTHRAYVEWFPEGNQGESTRILWICGPAGYGKTVLCTQLVEHLKSTVSSPLAYFFASPHAQSGGEPTFILRHWIAQIARLHPAVLDLVRQHSKIGQRASNYTIWSLFTDIVSDFHGCTFIVDGFDEYDRADGARTNFLRHLKKATDRTGSRFLMTSRIETDLEAELSPNAIGGSGQVILQCKITEKDVRNDISLFSKSVVDDKLPRKNDRLRQDLAERLTTKCEGMFLWIKLQRDQLRCGKNEKKLYDIVNNMPVGLHNTYERNWRAIQQRSPEDRERALAILKWTTYALRPLTVDEITEALLVDLCDDIGIIQWDNLPDAIDEDYINDEIVAICEGLVETRGDNSGVRLGMKTIHCIHPSVREYLLHALSPSSLDANKIQLGSVQSPSQVEQHRHLAMICLSYVNHAESWERWKSKGDPGDSSSFIDYAAKNWNLHMVASGKITADTSHLAKEFLDPGNKNFDHWRTYTKIPCSKFTVKSERDGATPLYYATLFNLPEIVSLILARDKSELNKVGGEYGTPLQAACYKGYEPIVQILLEWGADPNAKGGKFGVPINAAITEGWRGVVKNLLERGVDHSLKDGEGRTPLSVAARIGDCEVMCWLIEKGANVTVADDNGWTSLNIAAANGHFKVVKLLLKKGADLTVANSHGSTPLHSAAANGHLEVIKLLLEKGVDLKVASNNGWTPLNIAAANGHLEVVQLLLEKGADVTVADNNGWTPLNISVANDYLEVVKLLIEKGADVTVADNNGWTPLNVAAGNGHLEVVKLLFEKGMDLTIADKNGWMPLIIAAANGHLEIVRLLLEKDVDLIVANNNGWTPLNAAADNGHLEVIKLLLKKGADLTVANSHGSTPLHSAAANGHLEVIKLLLEKGVDLKVASNNGWTPLNIAAANGHLEVVQLLLEKGADVTVANNNGWTPLNVAAANGHLEVVKLLLEKGADLAVANSHGSTPLHSAAANDLLEVIKLLIKKGADVTIVSNDGWTPLNIAAANGHLEVVQLLLEKGADVTVTDNKGWTPLYSAANDGHLDVVKLLLERGTDVTVANNNGWTPLNVAAANGHLKVVKLLLEKGADLTVTNSYESTPLHSAAANGHLEVVKLLIKKGANAMLANNNGWTPLNIAAANGHLEVVKLLLEKGADAIVANNNGWTPLELAAFNDHSETVELLLENGLEFNSTDVFYGSSLNMLAFKG